MEEKNTLYFCFVSQLGYFYHHHNSCNISTAGHKPPSYVATWTVLSVLHPANSCSLHLVIGLPYERPSNAAKYSYPRSFRRNDELLRFTKKRSVAPQSPHSLRQYIIILYIFTNLRSSFKNLPHVYPNVRALHTLTVYYSTYRLVFICLLSHHQRLR